MPSPLDAQQIRGRTRGARNQASIVVAIGTILSNEGWGQLTAAAVGREAELSKSAVRQRGASPASLAQLVWEAGLGEGLIRSLTAVVQALDDACTTGNTDLLAGAWLRLTRQSVDQDAAVELLAASNVVPELAAFVQPDFATVLNLPSDDDSDHSYRGVRVAYAMSLALGILLTNRYPWAQDPGMAAALRLRANALLVTSAPVELPAADSSHMSEDPTIVREDMALDGLLRATLALISEFGYDAVTVKQIAAAAQATEGLIFSRYSNKLALVTDAIHRQDTDGWQLNAAFMRGIEIEHGLPIAEAVYLREATRPEHRTAQRMKIEQIRLSWHTPELLREAIDRLADFRSALVLEPGWGQIETEADFYCDVAAPLGALLLPRLHPSAHTLPWDVVTVPLFEAMRAQVRT